MMQTFTITLLLAMLCLLAQSGPIPNDQASKHSGFSLFKLLRRISIHDYGNYGKYGSYGSYNINGGGAASSSTAAVVPVWTSTVTLVPVPPPVTLTTEEHTKTLWPTTTGSSLTWVELPTALSATSAAPTVLSLTMVPLDVPGASVVTRTTVLTASSLPTGSSIFTSTAPPR